MWRVLKHLLILYKQGWFNNLQAAKVMRNFPTASIEHGVQFKGKLENLTLGQQVAIQFGTVIHLGGMAWCEHQGHLEIGDHAVVSPHCILYAAGPGGIRIGKNFDCGPGVGIFASRTDYRQGIERHVFAPVEIGDDVTIFANAVISPGITIGSGAVIAAGAVVTQDVPENVLVGGAPAKIIREDVKERYVRSG